MKKLLIIALLLFAINSFGQETFKKRYCIPNTITFKNGEKIYLKKDSIINYVNLTSNEQNELKKEYQLGKTISITKEIKLGENKVLINNNVVIDEAFYLGLSKSRITNAIDNKISGFVKFEEDGNLIVNRYLKKDSLGNYTRYATHYYKLKNRQTVTLRFQEIAVSALVIPIKYRFKGRNGLQEDFSTAFNANLFGGYSWGWSNFFHQEKVGNKTNTHKLTVGALFGASTVVLNQSNTSLDPAALGENETITKGVASFGLGATYAFNKINVGIFGGKDYAIGDSSSKWNYNKEPWIGLAIGYSLFNF